jgi:eukaryotic-like serine/threonine-protein kinase
MNITSGVQLGPYRIEAQLGEGGMGVVYRALDTKLNRPVAVKFLSADLADIDARRRFQREAQMASSLNHPHILTVYDVGEFEGHQYLVTEYVDGGTLKSWARAEKRTWRQIVELLVGVADGLAAAHQGGILHRDIKPDNILVARNGYAKLADFGLAKLAQVTQDDAATLTEGRTRQGVIIGSIPYMSPEQASGKTLDARSDVFSFGSVLFETLAARRPFVGTTSLELLQAIIHGSPSPLAELRPDLPVGLRMAVEKALEKDPAERYQTMREMVVDLRHLTRQSGELPAPAPPRRTRGLKWAAALTLFALMAGSAFLMFRTRQPAVPAQRQYIQLTNFADSATSPALSPDGRMLTFIRGESTFVGPGQVYVKLLPDGEPVQLTNDNFYKMSPKFSPDGARIAYATRIGTSTVAAGRETFYETWIVPVLGGQPRLLLTNAEGLTWLEDGAGQLRVLFSEITGRGSQMSIVSSTESRTGQRTVYMPPESGMAHRSFLSPDRQQVLVVEMSSSAWLPCRLTPFDGSSPGKPVGPLSAQCTDAAWSPDGKWMYFSANTGSGTHTWRQLFPDGPPEQVTFSVTQEEGIHFAPDGRSFVTSIGTSQSTLWVHDSVGDRQITSEGYSFLPSISPDGKTLYYLVRTGGTHNFTYTGGLWAADLDSGQRQRLLPDFQMQHYTISADGQRVVFVAPDEKGHALVWLASLNGRTAPRQLTTIDSSEAYFGAPGEVVFAADDQAVTLIYRIKNDGGELQKTIPTTTPIIPFGVSPDGRWVPAQDLRAPGSLMVYPAGGGSPTLICGSCSAPKGTERIPSPLSWTPDGRFLYLKFATSTYAIPLQPGQVLPPIPASGFQSKEAVAALPGARLISEEERVFPGPNPSIYAFVKVSTQRNIYRVPLP